MCEEDCSPLPLPDGAEEDLGGAWEPVVVLDEVVVEDEVEVEGELEVVVVEGDGELVVDVVEEVEEVELLLDDGAQVSDSEATTPVIGRFIWEIGVPGGTLTLNVYVWPPTTVTVTVQASANAAGRLPKARAMSNAAAVPRTANNWRRRFTAASLLGPSFSYALQCGNESTLRRAPEATECFDALQFGTGAAATEPVGAGSECTVCVAGPGERRKWAVLHCGSRTLYLYLSLSHTGG